MNHVDVRGRATDKGSANILGLAWLEEAAQSRGKGRRR